MLDQGEDGGVGADPESEGENRDRAKAGRLQQHAQGVTQISDHRRNSGVSPDRSRGRLACSLGCSVQARRPHDETAGTAILLIAKRDHGIDFHGPARGQDSGAKRGDTEEQNHGGIGQQIGRADTEKQRLQQSRRGEGA